MTNLDKFNPTTLEDLERRKRFEALSDEEKRLETERLKENAFIENIDSFVKILEGKQESEDREELELALKVCEAVKEKGGLALIVGGFARDAALAKFKYNVQPKDIDIEVYGIRQDKLKSILEKLGIVKITGEAFQVFKLKVGDSIKMLDVSLPRRDSKIGKGHKGFKVEGDPNMTVKEAARRRDFTINALALDPMTGELIDFYGGMNDIRDKTLRATDEELFGDDSLRVLRGAQFAGRFGFSIDKKTTEISRRLDLTELPKERIGEEWLKLLMKSEKPSVGLEAMRELGVLDKLHPEVKAIIGVPQSPEHHPEGDVWNHTKLVVDAAVQLAKDRELPEEEKLTLLLAALCHDLGKAVATRTEDGKIIAHGHDKDGLPITEKFLGALNVGKELTKKVLLLVEKHMFIHNVKNPVNAAVNRLARKLHPVSIRELANLATADVWGSYKYKISEEYPAAESLIKQAEKINVKNSRPAPLMMGRDLLAIGYKGGKRMGEILREIEELQTEGKLKTSEEAKRYAEVLFFIEHSERGIEPQGLLNGEQLDKEEMAEFIRERFLNEKVHDMGTLLMALILGGREIPDVLQKNKQAILTAHKFGPSWFSRFDKSFYNSSWKSFYGLFESADNEALNELKSMSLNEQTNKGLELILHPDENLIEKYDAVFNIKPETAKGRFALYNTESYPFEAGMFDGYKIMVQFQPEKRRVAISVMDENPDQVAEVDRRIRELLPEFRNARRTGYLFAEDEAGGDDSFTFNDAKRFYKILAEKLELPFE